VKGRYPSLADGERTSPGPNVFCSRFRRQTKVHDVRFGLASFEKSNSSIGAVFQAFLPQTPHGYCTFKKRNAIDVTARVGKTYAGTQKNFASLQEVFDADCLASGMKLAARSGCV
jgi:hypothetical protein